MRESRLSHTTRHMFLTLGGFVVAILLLESNGIANWASQLEPGPLRTIAEPAASALNRTLQPLGLAGARDRTLDEAARIGWSDDAVRVARQAPAPTVEAAAERQPAGRASSAPGRSILRSETKGVLPTAAMAPIVGSVPNSMSLAPLAPVEPGRERVVVLTGDSMIAVGFGSSLMRQASGNKNLRIVRAFKSGTGLARPDVFNWMDQYPAMVGSEKPEIVIVAIGANDGQSFVDDNKVLFFGTEEWRKTYQSRVANFLAMIESTGARVVWVGLPPMRSESFNQRISIVNRVAYTVISQDPKATWWSTATFVGDASGAYREFAQMPNGAMVRMRAPDGIHFAEEGASKMAAILMKWLDPPLPRVDGMRATPPVKAATPPLQNERLPQRATVAAADPEPARR